MAQTDYSNLLHTPGTAPLAGQLALRDVLLPDLLGEESHAISYWAGRAMARKLPLAEADLTAGFAALGLGALTVGKARRQAREFTLTGELVATRLRVNPDADFRLEAGFLAQSLQQQLGMVVEADATVDARHERVNLLCVLDAKDPQPQLTDFLSL